MLDELHEFPERITRHVEVDEDGCWLWTHNLNRGGYAQQIRTPVGRIVGHCAVWVLSGRERTPGLDLDHLCHGWDETCTGRGGRCKHRRCVNPAHLELVPHLENVRRGHTGEWNKEKTHCANGHALSGENLGITKDGKERYCKACMRSHKERYAAENRKHIVICASCRQAAPHEARGLCRVCYPQHRRGGTLAQFPRFRKPSESISPLESL